MLHVRRRTKLINRARGYTGSGYKRRARRPHGCTPARGGCDETGCWEGGDDCDVVLLRGDVTDSERSRIAGRTSARGKDDFRGCFGFGLNCNRSKPQSFVTSHQNEYKELTRAARSLPFQQIKLERRRDATDHTHHRRKRACSPCHASSITSSPFEAMRSDSTSRCAADKKITANELAYFRAFQSGRRLSFDGLLYSTTHCRKRTRYGRLDHIERCISSKGTTTRAYLINVGKIHLYQPYCFGGLKRLPPGRSMQNDSQTSPNTLANEVKMSAKITSAKNTLWFMGDDKHLLMLLYEDRGSQVRQRYREIIIKRGESGWRTYSRNASRWRFWKMSYGESINMSTTIVHTAGIYLKKSTRAALPCVAERYSTHAAEHHRLYQSARR